MWLKKVTFWTCVPSKGGCGNPVGRTCMALAWLWAPRSGTPAYPGCQLDHGVRIIHSTFFPLLGWSTTCVLPWSNTCGLLLLGEQSPTFEGGDGSISGGQVSFQGLEISTEDQSSQKPETTVYVSGARDQACVGGVSLHTWNCGLFGRAAQSRANFGEKHCNCCLIYIKLCSGCFPWWCVWSSIRRPQLPSIMEGEEIQLFFITSQITANNWLNISRRGWGLHGQLFRQMCQYYLSLLRILGMLHCYILLWYPL